MKKLIKASTYKGKIKAPASKSYMQRVVAIALLADGETCITNPSFCNDTLAVLKIAEQLGAVVTTSEDMVRIKGNKKLNDNTILSAGESGLGIRTFTPIAALYNKKIQLTGEGSLLQRPISMLEDPLTTLGANIQSTNGYLPVTVQGPLKGGVAKVDGSISSQVLTGLLISLPKALNDSILKVTDLQSIPYVDMTLEIIKDFGVDITHQNYEIFTIKGNQTYTAKNYRVEGDWSGVAFHLVGAALAGEVEVDGINTHSAQADRAILQAIEKAGANVEIFDDSVKVSKNKLQAFTFDATHCPDLFPPLVVLAAACKGTTILKGVNRLLHKESNRAIVLKNEMEKLNVQIKIKEDLMYVEGGKISGGKIHSNNDHRIAMAGAIAGLIAENAVEIEQAESINKSYPYFFKDFEKLTIVNS